jgi:DNA/RNA endonuclease YhcR with UshA esterase domain
MKYALTISAFLFFSLASHSQTTVKLTYLSDYIGDSVHVCGKVESARYMHAVDDSITLINIGGKYPDQLLTVVIWRPYRAQFVGKPEIDWIGKQVCVTGKVEMYREKPQITVRQTAQVQVEQ